MEFSVHVALVICLLSVLLLKWLRGGKKLPPGPINLPIVGYLPFLSRTPYFDFTKLAKKYGNIFRLRLGSNYVIILNDYDSIKEAFSQDAFVGRPPETPFDVNKKTTDLEAFNGLPWMEQRRFSLHMLKDLGFGKSKMEGQLQEEINELLEHYEKSDGKPIIIRDLLAPSMSNNIATLVFGKRLPYDDPDRKMMTEVLNAVGATAGQVTWQLFFPWLKTLFKMLGIGDVDRMSRISKNLQDYVSKEINEHEATLNPNNIRDYIDGYLLEMRKRKDDPTFCKEVLQDLVGAFFGAGSETVRLSVEWLLLAAAGHQEAQRRIQSEIDDVIGRHRLPTFPDLKSMPFTEAFIAELNRWRTIIPLNPLRYTVTDTQLGGYFIPKHSRILANLWAVHHDPEFWGADAEEFRPERFLNEDGKTVKKTDRLITFSIGKRACPGEPLAKIEVFLYFAAILQKFNVSMPQGKQPDYSTKLGLGLSSIPQDVIFSKRS